MAFINIGAGLAEAGKNVAATAGAWTLEAQKADAEMEKAKLVDQLAGVRQDKQNVFTSGESEKERGFKSGEGALERTSREKISEAQRQATIAAAGISAGAHVAAARYSSDTQERIAQGRQEIEREALTPAEVRTAQWFAKAGPDERDAFQSALLAKAGMPAWATGSGGAGTGAVTPPGGAPVTGAAADTATEPSGATAVPAAGTPPTPERKADSGVAPVTGTPNSKHNERALAGIPAPVADQVRAMVEGRMAPPPGFAASKPYWQAMLAKAAEYDPGFDQTTWASRVATRKDFTAGQSAKAVTALNTALGHAGTLSDNFDKLDNGSLPMWNAFVNEAGKQFGSDKVTNAQMAIGALAAEARKVFAATGGGSLTELKSWEESFPLNGSPRQQQGAMKQFVDLLDSRLQGLADQYNRGMKTTEDPLQLLEPRSRAVFQQLTGETPKSSTGYQSGRGPATAPPAPAASQPPPAAAALPPTEQRAIGRTYQTPTGPAMWMGNGWVRAPQGPPRGLDTNEGR